MKKPLLMFYHATVSQHSTRGSLLPGYVPFYLIESATSSISIHVTQGRDKSRL